MHGLRRERQEQDRGFRVWHRAAGWIGGLTTSGLLAVLYRLKLSFPYGRGPRLAGFASRVDQCGPLIHVYAHSGSGPEVRQRYPFTLPGKSYKFISNVIASIRLWGVAGFHSLEALMSTRLVRSNRDMSNR